LATLSIAQQRHILRHRVNNVRADKLVESISFNGNTYDADEQSIQNLTGIVAAIASGITLPHDFTWRTSDNQNVVFDTNSLLQFAATVMSRRNIIYTKSWQLKDAINSSLDLTNFDIITGW
jgi:hypothetical protein